MSDKFVSIIIPVYNDWTRLSICLKALDSQSYPKHLFEIIVVNNNPEDEMPGEHIVPTNCALIKEAKPGSYAARNAGIKLARGEILGFTDSDCIPNKDWIKNAVAHFGSNPTYSRLAGKISIFFRTAHPTRAELYEKHFAFNQNRYVATWGTSATANLFTYKHVFDSIGLFNENLMSGGDWNWGITAHKAGFKIDYADDVLVEHPARYSFREIINKEKRIGGGHALFLKKSKSNTINFIKLLQTLWPKQQEIKYINNYGRGLSLSNKIYFFLVRHYLLNIRAYERFRVQRGSKARRI